MRFTNRAAFNFISSAHDMHMFLVRQRMMRKLLEIYYKVEKISEALHSDGQIHLCEDWELRLYRYKWRLPKFYAALCADPHFEENMYEEVVDKIHYLLQNFGEDLPEAPSKPLPRQ